MGNLRGGRDTIEHFDYGEGKRALMRGHLSKICNYFL